MDTALTVKAFAGFFAIMNPFVVLPMFISFTSDLDRAQQRRTALRVGLYSTVMVVVLIASGTAVLRFFGIGIDDFRVAGGVVLMTIALGMLGGASPVHAGSAAEQEHQAEHATQGDVAFYPITFPMLIGPGTITTVVEFTSRAKGSGGYVAIAVAALVTLGLIVGVLWFASNIGHHLGSTLRTVMTRLMGMILAAIAVQMIIGGLANLLPGLTK